MVAAELSGSARRVQEAVAGRGFAFQVVEFPASTRTAADAAAAIGCEVAQIAKSLVFRTKAEQRPILVIASGVNRVNEKRLRELVGETIEKADAEFVRERTGFAIGGVPPVGHREALTIFIDEDLLALGEIWAAAGTPNAVFRLPAGDLPTLTGGRVAGIR
jgi:prolyl-tRNA editing enzyme YbaK/EbsC (Cys-tRNA(Pro) deacylase)